MTTTTNTREEVGRVLADMMAENTGRHFLDSSGENGRGWQRTRAAMNATGHEDDAYGYQESLPEAWPEIWRGGILGADADAWVTVSTYAFLRENLRVPDAEDPVARLWETTRDESSEEESWYELAARFVEEVLPNAGYVIAGIYGEGRPYSDNTYNRENNLSDDFQFHYWTVCDDVEGLTYGRGTGYLLLQIHRGADIRGGYTEPRLFVVDGDDGTEWLDWWQFGAYCATCETSWHFRGGDLDVWTGRDDVCQYDPDRIPGQTALDTGDARVPIEHNLVAIDKNGSDGTERTDEEESADADKGARIVCSHCREEVSVGMF